jgi:hypothetical protein
MLPMAMPSSQLTSLLQQRISAVAAVKAAKASVLSKIRKVLLMLMQIRGFQMKNV